MVEIKKNIKIMGTIKFISYPTFIFVFNYLGLDKTQMSILGILIIFDIFSGIIREYVINPKNLSSRIGIIGVLSKFLTITIPVVISLVTRGSGIDMTGIAKICISALIVYEGWSVLGNIMQIRKKDKTISEYDAVSMIIGSVQDVLKKSLQAILKK